MKRKQSHIQKMRMARRKAIKSMRPRPNTQRPNVHPLIELINFGMGLLNIANNLSSSKRENEVEQKTEDAEFEIIKPKELPPSK